MMNSVQKSNSHFILYENSVRAIQHKTFNQSLIQKKLEKYVQLDLLALSMLEKRLLFKHRNSPSSVFQPTLDELKFEKKSFPFCAYRFKLHDFLANDACFQDKENKTTEKQIQINDYETLRKLYAKTFKLLETIGKNDYADDREGIYEALKLCRIDLRKDYNCPNYFFFNNLHDNQEMLVFETPSVYNELVLTMTRSMERIKRRPVLNSHEIDRNHVDLPIVSVEDLIELIDSEIDGVPARKTGLEHFFSLG